jgi:hypothetical protein
MTQEQRRIKLAEAFGMTGWEEARALPDYFNDLNAVHDAVLNLPQGIRDNTYTSSLAIICGFNAHGFASWSELHAGRFEVINATASQRAEALGKTLNLW